jgi:hypothetical protein
MTVSSIEEAAEEERDDPESEVSERQVSGASTSAKERNAWSALLSVVVAICGIAGGFVAVVTTLDLLDQGKISIMLKGVAICMIGFALIAVYFQMRTMDRGMRVVAILTIQRPVPAVSPPRSSIGQAVACQASVFATPGDSDEVRGIFAVAGTHPPLDGDSLWLLDLAGNYAMNSDAYYRDSAGPVTVTDQWWRTTTGPLGCGCPKPAHVMRPADIRGGGRRAGRVVGRGGSQLSCGGEGVVGERPGRGRGVAGVR